MLQLHLYTPHPRLTRDQPVSLVIRPHELLGQYPSGLCVVPLCESFEFGSGSACGSVKLTSSQCSCQHGRDKGGRNRSNSDIGAQPTFCISLSSALSSCLSLRCHALTRSSGEGPFIHLEMDCMIREGGGGRVGGE